MLTRGTGAQILAAFMLKGYGVASRRVGYGGVCPLCEHYVPGRPFETATSLLLHNVKEAH